MSQLKKNNYVTQKKSGRIGPSKKSLLLKTGLKLFAKNGLNGTTIREIARTSGVNSSMISYHYDNKEGLYIACIEYIGQTQFSFVEEALEPATSKQDYKQRLQNFANQFIDLFSMNKYTGIILIREYDLPHSPAAKISKNIFKTTYDQTLNFFTEARKKGLIPSDSDPFTLCSFCLGLLFSQLRLDVINEKVYKRTLKNKTQRERFLENFLYSLKCE